ncbi:MAG: hypothetical protein K6A69_08620 [Lachnospiraceae bacterium]|nr:hypothetical protein [Lachnospiraceae bacterium]
MSDLTENKEADNEKALRAKSSLSAKNDFLTIEARHILHLTARILKRTVSINDDEWSVALMAVSEAIDTYEPEKNDFWNYAALVIGSRLKDHYRSEARRSNELLVSNDIFDGEPEEDSSDLGLKIEVRDVTAVVVDTGLKEEIQLLREELLEYGIELFDLPEHSPKAAKTKKTCGEILRSFFTPPPLTDELKKTKNFPFSSLTKRIRVSRKLVDKHRKFLIASVLIKAGDYPELKDYLPSDGV